MDRCLLKTGGLMPEVGAYQWVASCVQLIAHIEKLHEQIGKPADVSMTPGRWACTRGQRHRLDRLYV